MQHLQQSPKDPGFVQDPYPVYARARVAGPVLWWDDFGMPAVFDYKTVNALFRDKRLGRECPPEQAQPVPPHLAPFMAVEAHSMLELEPPRHTRLRALVLRAFTSRRIAAMGPELEAMCHALIDRFPDDVFDLLPAYCNIIPVRIIARLLGVPEDMAPQLLDWSHAMVAMYQPGRSRAVEDAAAQAAGAFSAFLQDYVRERRDHPADDLITQLILAEANGQKLSTDELITTCILLLNAGHEATVHSMGNAVKILLEKGNCAPFLTLGAIASTVEELLRHDPPLHIFTRYVYEPVVVGNVTLTRGDQVALVLGAANRDPARWEDPDHFDPTRPVQINSSFGGGLHFCVGAPLARLELQIGLRVLFERHPDLQLVERPRYADTYHFHGLERLMVRAKS